MIKLLSYFWMALIGASILWYGVLVFVVGVRGGRDIKEMLKKME